MSHVLFFFCESIIIGGGCLFVLSTLVPRRGYAGQFHSNSGSGTVASMTASCHSINRMNTGIPSMIQSSELANDLNSSSMSIDRKIHSNNLKVNSFHHTEPLNRAKTVFSISIPPPTVHPQYRLVEKKIDQSPSFCRAIVNNLNCGAVDRISCQFQKSKKNKKKKKGKFSKKFFLHLKKRVKIHKKNSGNKSPSKANCR